MDSNPGFQSAWQHSWVQMTRFLDIAISKLSCTSEFISNHGAHEDELKLLMLIMKKSCLVFQAMIKIQHLIPDILLHPRGHLYITL